MIFSYKYLMQISKYKHLLIFLKPTKNNGIAYNFTEYSPKLKRVIANNKNVCTLIDRLDMIEV